MNMNARLRTIILINLASILEKCDEQILPALYARVGATFDATPTQLGNITLARAFMQAISSPFAGIACHFYPRSHIIGAGCLIWATFTALFGMSHFSSLFHTILHTSSTLLHPHAACTSSIAWALPICAINGIGLALVIPSVQSLTADLNPSDSRGRAFGSLWLTISMGGMLGTLYATNVGATAPFGMEGWRFAFWTVAVLSAVAGLLNAAYVVDPIFTSSLPVIASPSIALSVGSLVAAVTRWARRTTTWFHQPSQNGEHASHATNSDTPTAIQRPSHTNDDADKPLVPESTASPRASVTTTTTPPMRTTAALRHVVNEIQSVVKIPTFAIIIIQGIVGSVPYASLVFLTLYLQLLGMSDASASLMVALYLAGGGLGGLLGGWIGDLAAEKYPNHGRIAATQFSVASGIPFAFLIFKGLPFDGRPTTVAWYAASIFLFAVSTSWPAPCANNPIFAEIVPVKQRNLVYSFDRCFEGAVAAFATPLVGSLSQNYFNFQGSSRITGDPSVDVPNARALGNALLVFLTVPWTLCFLIYSGLHWTYPRDKKKAYFLNVVKLDGVDNDPGNGGDGSYYVDDGETLELGTGNGGGGGGVSKGNATPRSASGSDDAGGSRGRMEARRVPSRLSVALEWGSNQDTRP